MDMADWPWNWPFSARRPTSALAEQRSFSAAFSSGFSLALRPVQALAARQMGKSPCASGRFTSAPRLVTRAVKTLRQISIPKLLHARVSKVRPFSSKVSWDMQIETDNRPRSLDFGQNLQNASRIKQSISPGEKRWQRRATKNIHSQRWGIRLNRALGDVPRSHGRMALQKRHVHWRVAPLVLHIWIMATIHQELGHVLPAICHGIVQGTVPRAVTLVHQGPLVN